MILSRTQLSQVFFQLHIMVIVFNASSNESGGPLGKKYHRSVDKYVST